MLPKEQVSRIKIEAIRQNRYQPRQRFEETKIQELADSIRESGLIYPLLVRKSSESGLNRPVYDLIAGERRLRALKLLEETEVPAIVRETTNEQALELALIENLQREGLNPIEEAQAYNRLAEEFSLTQEQIAAKVGRERATVTNTLRLLKLPTDVQKQISDGKLTLGHAKALLGLESDKTQRMLAEKIVKQGLSVRQAEALVRKTTTGGVIRRKAKDPNLASAEERLQRSLGTDVQIQHGRKKGWIRIAYYSLKDLDRLMGRLSKQ